MEKIKDNRGLHADDAEGQGGLTALKDKWRQNLTHRSSKWDQRVGKYFSYFWVGEEQELSSI